MLSVVRHHRSFSRTTAALLRITCTPRNLTILNPFVWYAVETTQVLEPVKTGIIYSHMLDVIISTLIPPADTMMLAISDSCAALKQYVIIPAIF